MAKINKEIGLFLLPDQKDKFPQISGGVSGGHLPLATLKIHSSSPLRLNLDHILKWTKVLPAYICVIYFARGLGFPRRGVVDAKASLFGFTLQSYSWPSLLLPYYRTSLWTKNYFESFPSPLPMPRISCLRIKAEHHKLANEKNELRVSLVSEYILNLPRIPLKKNVSI